MTLVHYYNNGALTSAVALKTQKGYSAAADLGNPDTINVEVDDPSKTYDFVPYKTWYMIEDACTPDFQAWRGYVFDQELEHKGTDILHVTGRSWGLALFEVNGLLTRYRYQPDDATANRAAETVDARIAWVISSFPFAGVCIDHELVASSSLPLDASDYRKRTPQDVLNDCAQVTGFNFLLRHRLASDDVELIFHDFNTSGLDTCSLTISNVTADVNYTTCFPPSEDTKLKRVASRIASNMIVAYQGGDVAVSDATTAATFAPVSQVAATAVPKTAAKALALGNRLLAQHNEMDEHITTTLRLPASKLDIVQQGQLLSSVKLTHFPGWEDGRPARCLKKTFSTPDNETDDFYDVELELSPACGALPFVIRTGELRNIAGVGNEGKMGYPFTPSTGSLLLAQIGQRSIATTDTTPSDSDGWTLIAKDDQINGVNACQALFAIDHDGIETQINVGLTTNRWGWLWEISGGPAASTLSGDGVVSAGTGYTMTGGALSATANSLLVMVAALTNDNRAGGQHCWTPDGAANLEYGMMWPNTEVGPYLAGEWLSSAEAGSVSPTFVISECPAPAWTTAPPNWGTIGVVIGSGNPCA